MKNAFKYIVYVVFTLLPLIFALVITFDSLQDLKNDKFLGESFKVEDWNKWLTYLTILLPVLVIGVTNIYAERKINIIEERTSSLLEMTKDSFYSLIRKICGDNNLPVEMKLPLRIYKPRYSDYWLWHVIMLFLCKNFKSSIQPVKFVAVSLDGKTVPKKPQYYVRNTRKMRKRVPQGIVGKSFQENKVLIDDNLIENADIYNLSEQQYGKVLDLNFAIACPLSDQRRVTHIVTFDCREEFKIPEKVEDEVQMHVIRYVNEVRKNFPQLFF